MDNNEDRVNEINMVNMATEMNYKLHAEQLDIPVFNFMKREESSFPQVIVIASGNGYMEQFVSDGFIKDGEFESRINLVINNAKKIEGIQNEFYYYKDYSNGLFDFKLYFQDIIIPINGGNKISRVLNAYFVEPKMHDFYQFSLSVGPFDMPTNLLKPGLIDVENDEITKKLSEMMKNLIDNLKYK